MRGRGGNNTFTSQLQGNILHPGPIVVLVSSSGTLDFLPPSLPPVLFSFLFSFHVSLLQQCEGSVQQSVVCILVKVLKGLSCKARGTWCKKQDKVNSQSRLFFCKMKLGVDVKVLGDVLTQRSPVSKDAEWSKTQRHVPSLTPRTVPHLNTFPAHCSLR